MSEDLKTHICTECTKHIGFTTEKAQRKHSSDVHGPRQKCPHCDFTYSKSREDNLRQHISIKHTMDSRVVVDTSSQGVTESTAPGSQTELTEVIDEGPLDLSIKVRDQSPLRETQTITASTNDTSKTPQSETSSQGSSPIQAVRSVVKVISPIRPLTLKKSEKRTKKSTRDSSTISNSRRGALSSYRFSRVSYFKVIITHTFLIQIFKAKVKVSVQIFIITSTVLNSFFTTKVKVTIQTVITGHHIKIILISVVIEAFQRKV